MIKYANWPVPGKKIIKVCPICQSDMINMGYYDECELCGYYE